MQLGILCSWRRPHLCFLADTEYRSESHTSKMCQSQSQSDANKGINDPLSEVANDATVARQMRSTPNSSIIFRQCLATTSRGKRHSGRAYRAPKYQPFDFIIHSQIFVLLPNKRHRVHVSWRHAMRTKTQFAMCLCMPCARNTPARMRALDARTYGRVIVLHTHTLAARTPANVCKFHHVFDAYQKCSSFCLRNLFPFSFLCFTSHQPHRMAVRPALLSAIVCVDVRVRAAAGYRRHRHRAEHLRHTFRIFLVYSVYYIRARSLYTVRSLEKCDFVFGLVGTRTRCVAPQICRIRKRWTCRPTLVALWNERKFPLLFMWTKRIAQTHTYMGAGATTRKAQLAVIWKCGQHNVRAVCTRERDTMNDNIVVVEKLICDFPIRGVRCTIVVSVAANTEFRR